MQDMSQGQALRLIEVHGSHHEMGRQHGEALREETRQHVDWLLETSSRRSGLSREQLMGRVSRCVPIIEDYAPHLAEEIRGVADGAGLDQREVYAVQLIKELLLVDPNAEECSTFAIAGERSANGQTIVGQNVDSTDTDLFFGFILKMTPLQGPRVLMYTKAGLVSYVGLSESGVAAHGNMLSAPNWRAGYPRYLLTRLMLAESNVDAAIEACLRPRRASSRNFMLGDAAGGIADLELTVDQHAVLRSDTGMLVHANHYVDPSLEHVNAANRGPSSSVHRHCRLGELMASAGRPLSLADMQGFFRDHDGYPGSVCAHPGEGLTSRTKVSVISEPGEGRLHATHGNPCERDYVTYSL